MDSRWVLFFLFFLTFCFAHRHARDGVPRNGACGTKRPHIVTVMVDDLGVSNVGFSARRLKKLHNVQQLWYEADSSIFTPNLDRLAASGLQLSRHYAYSACTPSRASFFSGRLPVHLGVVLGEPMSWDGGSNPSSGYDGLSPNITTIARVMRSLGYRTHLSGKADGFGMATREHVPAGRGFDSSLSYFYHANDYYNYTVGPKEIAQPPPCESYPNGTGFLDQWQDYHNANRPPSRYVRCDDADRRSCVYEDKVLTDRALDVINDFDVNGQNPLFLAVTLHSPHTPLVGPPVDYISQECGQFATGPFQGQCAYFERSFLLQMMAYADRQVKRIEDALRSRPGMWENTLFLFLSDNGGGSGLGVGGNVFPYRGGKGSDWEGGFLVRLHF